MSNDSETGAQADIHCANLLEDNASDFAKVMLDSLRRGKQLEKWDGRRLLWTAKKLGIEDEINLFGPLSDVWDEISNRLYPEYDAETFTWQEWGWMTPDGEIRYVPSNAKAQGIALRPTQ